MTTARDRPIDRRPLIGELEQAGLLRRASCSSRSERVILEVFLARSTVCRWSALAGGDWSSALFARPIYLLSEPYARSAAVLVDELDSSAF